MSNIINKLTKEFQDFISKIDDVKITLEVVAVEEIKK